MTDERRDSDSARTRAPQSDETRLVAVPAGVDASEGLESDTRGAGAVNETNEVIGTEPPDLLDAMLAYVNRRGCYAERVTGYRERSYNIGYCETCYDMCTDVRIFYVKADGTEAHYQVGFTDLGELIRDLTNEPGQQQQWSASAKRETEEERDERWYVHDFDEEPRP